MFLLFLIFSTFIFFSPVQAVTGDYNKPVTGTLAASEWNNLVNDFVAKSGSRLDGNFSINTATSSGYALDISGILRASHFSGSLSAADVSTGVFGQNTGGGDFNFLGNVGIGIGTSSPNSIITIANDRWISALNNAGNGYVNIFKVNANDELEIGGALNVGQFQFAEDSGFNTFVDMPVSAAPGAGAIEGYTMKVDGDNILTVYSEANGTGGVQNKRVGIGTSTPAFTLDVAGIVNASALYVNGAPYIGSQWTTNGTSLYYNTGNVGVGISNPAAKFEVSGGNIFINDALITSGTPKAAITKEYLDSALASSSASIITQVATSSFWQGSLTGNVYNANTGNIGIGTTNPVYGKVEITTGASNTGGLTLYRGTGNTARHWINSSDVYLIQRAATDTYGLAINNVGNVGIGTTDPGVYRLKVAGDAAITGTLQTQTGSDFAEEFSVGEDISAGTVVVMAENGHKSVKASSQAYDPTVVGVVSDNPSIIAGRVDSEKKVIVAMMGVVSVKADNGNGKIRKGDLLTTSDVAGRAMKATNVKPGTIIGKALEDLSGQSGYIKVLVNLQ